jgi:type IV secretion system protein VirD4
MSASTAAAQSPVRSGTARRAGPAALTRLRTGSIILAVLLYAVLAVTATSYIAAGIVRLAWKQPFSSLAASSPNDVLRAWEATADHPTSRNKVLLAILLPGVVFGVMVPFGIMAATQTRRPLHGAARFANRGEIARSGLMSDDGILLGRLGNQYLRLPGQQSVLLSAPTRSGKGVGIVVPNLLAWKGSVVVLDIKGENFELTAGYRARHGQHVFRWAPFDADNRSHRWNPLSYIRTDPRHAITDTLAIAQMLYPSTGNASSNETFFADQAKNLFLGLVLLMLATPERPRTLGELLRQASGQGRPLHEHLRSLISARHLEGRPLPDACVDALNRFLSTSENTLSSILATLNAPLTLFADPMVDAATSGDDFSLQDLRRKRLSIYLVIPANRLAESAVLLNLFFAQAVHQNTDELPEKNPELKVPCLLLLDEAAAVGKIAVLSKAIGFLAGYGLRVLTVVQSISQLESVYGRDDARTFATNHAAQILFAPREQRDANEYSEMLGTFTQRERSNGRSVSNGARGSSTSTSTNVSSQRRPLLLPQEFKELGTDKQVIVLENQRPILADKIRYFDEPVFTERLEPAPETPRLDLELHIARTESRVRAVNMDETLTPEQVAHEFSHLPSVTMESSDEDLLALVGQILDVVEADNERMYRMGHAAATDLDADRKDLW